MMKVGEEEQEEGRKELERARKEEWESTNPLER